MEAPTTSGGKSPSSIGRLLSCLPWSFSSLDYFAPPFIETSAYFSKASVCLNLFSFPDSKFGGGCVCVTFEHAPLVGNGTERKEGTSPGRACEKSQMRWWWRGDDKALWIVQQARFSPSPLAELRKGEVKKYGGIKTRPPALRRLSLDESVFSNCGAGEEVVHISQPYYNRILRDVPKLLFFKRQLDFLCFTSKASERCSRKNQESPVAFLKKALLGHDVTWVTENRLMDKTSLQVATGHCCRHSGENGSKYVINSAPHPHCIDFLGSACRNVTHPLLWNQLLSHGKSSAVSQLILRAAVAQWFECGPRLLGAIEADSGSRLERATKQGSPTLATLQLVDFNSQNSSASAYWLRNSGKGSTYSPKHRKARTRNNGQKLIKERSNLELRRNFLTVKTINHWNSLPPEIVGTPSLEVLLLQQGAGLEDLQGLPVSLASGVSCGRLQEHFTLLNETGPVLQNSTTWQIGVLVLAVSTLPESGSRWLLPFEVASPPPRQARLCILSCLHDNNVRVFGPATFLDLRLQNPLTWVDKVEKKGSEWIRFWTSTPRIPPRATSGGLPIGKSSSKQAPQGEQLILALGWRKERGNYGWKEGRKDREKEGRKEKGRKEELDREKQGRELDREKEGLDKREGKHNWIERSKEGFDRRKEGKGRKEELDREKEGSWTERRKGWIEGGKEGRKEGWMDRE
ncbi:Zinc finger CCCH domain-containing protein 13, partial [Ophiophagus hannah]